MFLIKDIIDKMFLTDDVKERAKEKIKICLEPEGVNNHCRFYNPEGSLGPKCNKCNCLLRIKILTKSKCPDGRWDKLKEE